MSTIDIRGASLSGADPPIGTNPNPDLAIKAPVRVATTGSNINLQTIGLGTIDGVALAAGDRVLVKDQTDATTNGLYNASTGPWTRTIDANNNSQWAKGLQVAVTDGTTNANTPFVCTATSPITLGTSNLTFQGSFNSSIAPGAITNAKLAQMAAKTIKGNNTSGLANALDLTGDQAEQILLFTQAGTGAVQQALDAKVKLGFLHAKDFAGVDPTGVSDSTAGLQAWINQGQTSQIPCFLDPGVYKTTTALSITATIKIFGAGPQLSQLSPAANIDCIDISTVSPVYLEDFYILYSSTGNAGTQAISLSAPGSAENQVSRFRNLALGNWNIGFHAVKADLWVMDDCYIFSNSTAGIGVLIENQFNADHGDNVIANSTFAFSTSATNVAVAYASAGGLRFIGNKINTVENGISLNLSSGAFTADLQIIGNSIEGFSGNGIQFARAGATGSFANVIISGNEFATGTPNTNAIAVSLDAVGAWLSTVAVNGNTWTGPGSGTNNFIALNSTNGFSISDNVVNGSGGGTNVGYAIGSTAINGIIDAGSVTTGSVTTFANSSTSTVLIDRNGVAFANLAGTAANGSQIFVTNGTPASSPLTGGGSGSMAFRQNGAWKGF